MNSEVHECAFEREGYPMNYLSARVSRCTVSGDLSALTDLRARYSNYHAVSAVIFELICGVRG